MKACAWIKFKVHPDSKSAGTTRGDIVDILPFWNKVPPETKMMETFLPIGIDITIPCDKDFAYVDGKRSYDCGSCPDNDPEICDVIRYTRGYWGTGTVLDPPKLIKKRRFFVDIDSKIPAESLIVAEKTDKTEIEAELTLSAAKNNTLLASDFTDKV